MLFRSVSQSRYFGLLEKVFFGYGCVSMKSLEILIVMVVRVSIGMNSCCLLDIVFCLFGNCIECVVLKIIG